MNFLARATPPSFMEALKRLEEHSPALLATKFMMGDGTYLEWAHSVCVASNGGLRALTPPIPPLRLRSIVAAAEEELFLWTGARDISIFMGLYDELHVGGKDRPAKVLDFGCGCGRMTRYLAMANSVEAYASEINADHVRWCRDNLDRVDTRLNGFNPPLEFDSDVFDMAYSLSIFTHLDEGIATAWLKDLTRVLAPGGLLIVTTHGYTAAAIVRDSCVHQSMFRLKPAQTQAIIDKFATNRFVYIPFAADIVEAAKAGPAYGNTFIHPSYIEEKWNAHGLEVVRQIPGGLRGWQDIVVMRKVA